MGIKNNQDTQTQNLDEMLDELKSSSEIPHETAKQKVKENPNEFQSEVPTKPYESNFTNVENPDANSDEGWQEAISRGRSGNLTNRKPGPRRPALPRLKLSTSFSGDPRESEYKRKPVSLSSKIASPARTPHPDISTVVKNTKITTSTSTEALIPRFSAIASKSISYKQVAVSPPGSVLKPALEKLEYPVKDDQGLDGKIDGGQPQEHETEVTSDKEASDPKKLGEATIVVNRKLSASAPPFSPKPVVSGRSSLYYKPAKQDHSPIAATIISNSSSVMNPHAAEFVPGRVSPKKVERSDRSEEKNVEDDRLKNGKGKRTNQCAENSEMAKQILLSFIVKSVQENFATPENEEGKDPLKTNEGNPEKISISPLQSEADSSNEEGFTKVERKRKNKQFGGSANGLIAHQSICTSAG